MVALALLVTAASAPASVIQPVSVVSDTTAPQTTITSGPTGRIKDTTPTFAFTSSEAGSSFTCAIDAGAFAACTSPRTTAPLARGAHTFRVNFSYPSGSSAHNVRFTGSQPSSCTQTAGPSSGAVPPLPSTPTVAGWAGNCTFTAVATYAFACALHRSMTGSVTVTAGARTALARG